MLDLKHSGLRPASYVMEEDARLLESLGDVPLLHNYTFVGKAATFGYFVKPEDFLHLDVAREVGLELARRPTGGGLIFHSFDLAFSFFMPASHPAFSTNTLANYAFVNLACKEAIRAFCGTESDLLVEGCGPCLRFCMASPTQYDLVVGGKKVGGAAQRRTKRGYLHQGSLCLLKPDSDWLRAVCKNPAIFELMQTQSYPLLQEASSLEAARERLQQLLFESLKKTLRESLASC